MPSLDRNTAEDMYNRLDDDAKHAVAALIREGKSPSWAIRMVKAHADEGTAFTQGSGDIKPSSDEAPDESPDVPSKPSTPIEDANAFAVAAADPLSNNVGRHARGLSAMLPGTSKTADVLKQIAVAPHVLLAAPFLNVAHQFGLLPQAYEDRAFGADAPETQAARTAPAAYGAGQFGGDVLNAEMAGAGAGEMMQAGVPRKALDALKAIAGGARNKAAAVDPLAIAEHGPGGRMIAKGRELMKGPPGSSSKTAAAMGGTEGDWMTRPDAPTPPGPGALPPPTQFEHVADFGAGDLVDEAPWHPPMDDTAVDLTPEMIKRPALENLKAATADPVPAPQKPGPFAMIADPPDVDAAAARIAAREAAANGERPPLPFAEWAARPQATDPTAGLPPEEVDRLWPKITPEPDINVRPIPAPWMRDAPSAESVSASTGNERPGLRRLRQATADQPPKVGTSPAPSTEATSTAQMPNEQMGRLRNDSARDGAGPWSDSIDAGGDPVFDEQGNEQLNPGVRAGWRGAAARFKAAIEGGPTGDVSGMMDEDVNANLGLGGRTKGGLQGSSAYFPKRNADLGAQMANPDLAPPTQDAAANLRATSRTVDPNAAPTDATSAQFSALLEQVRALPPEEQAAHLAEIAKVNPLFAQAMTAMLRAK